MPLVGEQDHNINVTVNKSLPEAKLQSKSATLIGLKNCKKRKQS